MMVTAHTLSRNAPVESRPSPPDSKIDMAPLRWPSTRVDPPAFTSCSITSQLVRPLSILRRETTYHLIIHNQHNCCQQLVFVHLGPLLNEFRNPLNRLVVKPGSVLALGDRGTKREAAVLSVGARECVYGISDGIAFLAHGHDEALERVARLLVENNEARQEVIEVVHESPVAVQMGEFGVYGI